MTTIKYLKLQLLISAIFNISTASALPADTLRNTKFSTVEFNYGVPVFNRISLDGDYSGRYYVYSKPKSCFEFRVGIVRRNNSLLLGFSLMQSDFRGRDYTLGAGTIPYKGTKYPYYYNMYQTVAYNVFYFNAGYGYDFIIKKKHVLTPYIQLSLPISYTFKINNYYTPNQSSDTTLFKPSRNSWNSDTNFGHFPRLSVGVTYKYQCLDRLAVQAKVHVLYAYTYNSKRPDSENYESAFNHTNNYSFLAYQVSRQLIVLPSVGINFNINTR